MEVIGKRDAWNKGKLVGQKPPLKLRDIWAIRIHLQNVHAVRELAMFNLAIDSKLRGCDLVSLRVRDVTHGSQILLRTMVVQRKTQRPVQFELTEPTRAAVAVWLEKAQLHGDQYLRAGWRVLPIFRLASTRGSCIIGLQPLGWIHPLMERTRCGAPKPP